MNGLGEVRAGQQVLGSDGGMIGVVEGVEGDVIAVRGSAEHGSGHHHVPADWVERVDDHVHLNRTAALARDTWTDHDHGRAGGAAGAAAPMPRRTEGKKGSWLPWLMLAVVVALALWVLMRGLAYQDDPSTSDPGRATERDAAK